jgi:hypothetical protein
MIPCLANCFANENREAILDLAVNELDAEQREQYARNHATVLREADWEKYKHIVDAFRDFTFGDFSPLGGIADATASPGKYDGVTWDDDSKTPNKYRIDRGLYGGVACGVGQDLVSIDPFKSEAGLLSQSHPDLMGVAAASTLNSGGEYSGSVFTEATSVTKPTVVPARKSSRATMKSTASPGIDQDLSVVVQEDSEKRSNKSAVSDVPTHGVLSRKKSAAVVAASGVTPASPQRDVGMIAQSHPSKQSVPEVSKTTEINAESRNDSQGKRHSKSGLGSKAQAMLASGAAIVGFGADGFVTLGLHVMLKSLVLYRISRDGHNSGCGSTDGHFLKIPHGRHQHDGLTGRSRQASTVDMAVNRKARETRRKRRRVTPQVAR